MWKKLRFSADSRSIFSPQATGTRVEDCFIGQSSDMVRQLFIFFYISCKKMLNLCLVAYFPTAFESCEKKSHSLIGPKEQVHRTIMKAIRKTGVKIHKTTSACTCSFKKLLIHSKTFGVTRLKAYNFNITTCVYGKV
jgi:hypothetical protein